MSKSNAKNFLFVEKFRPKSVTDMVLPATYKKFFKEITQKEQIPNLLLQSTTPGAGKSTIAKAICNDVDADYIYINISKDSGIDTLRSQIAGFASTKSFNGKPKIVILDEFDGATHQLQAGLRAFIEEFHEHCRFILTCNYANKIIEPLREGRIMEFNFNMKDKKTVTELRPKMIKHLANICKFEEIKYEEDALAKLVDISYPNMRRMIASLQKASIMFGQIDENILSISQVDTELYGLILERKFTAARTMIIENAYDHGEMYSSLYHNLVPMIEDKGAQAQVILIISDYQQKHTTAIDTEIPLAACLLEIVGAL
jgi:DNA polymerase III delta prime subunit